MVCFKTTRSGARKLRDDSVACAVIAVVRIAKDTGVNEADTEASARGRRAMG